MLLIFFGGIGAMTMQTSKTALVYVGALLAQFVLGAIAARNYGVRFANTVLALKAAS
ncbi:hypothetical protein ACVIIV_003461 [Bradyrhizobium sp. USDA 4354]